VAQLEHFETILSILASVGPMRRRWRCATGFAIWLSSERWAWGELDTTWDLNLEDFGMRLLHVAAGWEIESYTNPDIHRNN
jgi:hypothetical protein